MSGADAARPWPGEPQECTCTQTTAARLGGTMDCPAGWYQDQDGTWVHVPATQAAS